MPHCAAWFSRVCRDLRICGTVILMPGTLAWCVKSWCDSCHTSLTSRSTGIFWTSGWSYCLSQSRRDKHLKVSQSFHVNQHIRNLHWIQKSEKFVAIMVGCFKWWKWKLRIEDRPLNVFEAKSIVDPLFSKMLWQGYDRGDDCQMLKISTIQPIGLLLSSQAPVVNVNYGFQQHF